MPRKNADTTLHGRPNQPEGAQDAVDEIWETIQRQSNQLCEDIMPINHEIRVDKRYDWAQKLLPLSKEENSQARQCSSCGSALHPELKHLLTAVIGPACSARNEIPLLPATEALYRADIIRAVIEKETYEDFLRVNELEDRYRGRLDEISAEKKKAYLQAQRAYNTQFWTRYQELHPGFTESVEAMVESRMKELIA